MAARAPDGGRRAGGSHRHLYPEIVGNGKNIITSLIHYEFDAARAAVLLFLKIFTVAIVFGVGTVGAP